MILRNFARRSENYREEKMKIFDDKRQTPKYLDKHGTFAEIVLIALVFVIVPIISVVIATRGDMRAVEKSLSWLGYREDYLALVYFWGLLNIVAFVYALKMLVDAGKYTSSARRIIYALTAISCLILLIGVSVPYLDGTGDEVAKFNLMRKIHNAFSTVGLVMFFVVVIGISISTLARNKRQFAISMGMLAFVLITSILLITQANVVGSRCQVTAIAQVYMFSAFEVVLGIEYFLMREMTNERIENTSVTDANATE